MEEHPAHFGWKLAHRFHEQYSISNLALHSFFMLSSDRYVIHFVLRTSLANFQIRSHAQSLSRQPWTTPQLLENLKHMTCRYMKLFTAISCSLATSCELLHWNLRRLRNVDAHVQEQQMCMMSIVLKALIH